MESSPNTAWTVGTDGQGEDGVSGWKVTKRPHHREGGLGFLLKAAQDDQTSPGDGEDGGSDQIPGVGGGDSHSTGL